MTPRFVLFATAALGVCCLGAPAWSQTVPEETLPDAPSEEAPLQLSAPLHNPNAIFRNELTDVEIKDDTPTTISDFGALYSGTQRSDSSLHITQKVGDQLTVEETSKIGMQKNGDLGLQHFGDDSTSWGQGASAYNVLTGTWAPAANFHVAATATTENDLTGQSSAQFDGLLMEAQKVEAGWQATPHTSISFSNNVERDYDSSSLNFDSYRATGFAFSQVLGKSNVTWNVAPSWQEDYLGKSEYSPASEQAGPQIASSLDWKPSTGTKWSLGGTWNRLEAVSNALAQTTRDVFLAYDHSVAKNLQFQLRTEGKDVRTPDAVATGSATPADQRELSFQVGQRLALSNTLSAALDFRHSIQQQSGEAWTTAESLATFSLQKSF